MRLLWLVMAGVASTAVAEEAVKPGTLRVEELAEFESLGAPRKELVRTAVAEGRRLRLGEYVFGSADPDRGGFDCSGSMVFLLNKVGVEPPRTSAGQWEWLKENGRAVEVPPGATLEDEVFSKLKPGDLLFWAGTYEPTDGRASAVTHVQMYLGREKSDGRRVMIGSSDGRSYRGQKRCGFGVFDFRLPRPGSKARFVGFGSPLADGS